MKNDAPCGQRPEGYDNAISSDNPVVTLLYLILRDHISPGKMEELVYQACRAGKPNRFSNDFLAAYAIELRERLGGMDDAEAVKLGRSIITAVDSDTAK